MLEWPENDPAAMEKIERGIQQAKAAIAKLNAHQTPPLESQCNPRNTQSSPTN